MTMRGLVYDELMATGLVGQGEASYIADGIVQRIKGNLEQRPIFMFSIKKGTTLPLRKTPEWLSFTKAKKV